MEYDTVSPTASEGPGDAWVMLYSIGVAGLFLFPIGGVASSVGSWRERIPWKCRFPAWEYVLGFTVDGCFIGC